MKQSTRTPSRIGSAAVCALLCVACGDASNASQPVPKALPDAAIEDNRCPADTPSFSAAPETGLQVMGKRAQVQARVIGARPAQPQRFENDWTIQFTDASGATLDGIVIADVCAYMPVHAHGGAPQAVNKAGPGTFTLTGLNLFMRGPWEVQLAVNAGTAEVPAQEATNCDRERRRLGGDLLVFHACISDD